jgi:hypothetical protein
MQLGSHTPFILTFSKIKETSDKAPHSNKQINNMKINTKKCTPIKGTSDSVMVHPNKYIDNGVTVLVPPAEESTDEIFCSGRERKYLPTMIYSTVMTSKRLDSYHRLLSNNDIDELNQKLENLFMDEKGSNNKDKDKPQLKEREEESKDDHEKYPDSKKKDKAATTSEEATTVLPLWVVSKKLSLATRAMPPRKCPEVGALFPTETKSI